MMGRLPLALLLAALVLPATLQARGFRQVHPIATPIAVPEGAVRLERREPVSRKLVERALHAIARAWNTGALDDLLGEDFVNRQRLLDTLTEVVPRDARLRIKSVRGINTVEQYLHERDDGRVERVSIVLATASTQIEFNDPEHGFQRLEGTNQYLLRVIEPVS